MPHVTDETFRNMIVWNFPGVRREDLRIIHLFYGDLMCNFRYLDSHWSADHIAGIGFSTVRLEPRPAFLKRPMVAATPA